MYFASARNPANVMGSKPGSRPLGGGPQANPGLILWFFVVIEVVVSLDSNATCDSVSDLLSPDRDACDEWIGHPLRMMYCTVLTRYILYCTNACCHLRLLVRILVWTHWTSVWRLYGNLS
jgi:hypothetical protein